jgi:ZIP family zinc transporter
VSALETVVLGAVAGFTIFVGLPMGRLGHQSRAIRTYLNGVSAGILIFLLFDILQHATEPLEDAVRDGAWAHLAAVGLLFAVGFGLGLLGLQHAGRAWRRRPGRSAASLGPGAMAVAESPAEIRSEALRVGMSIAIGIGLHNFSEGLAIGQAASAGEVSLALVLVIGFALHNGTEGFGIVGPLAAAGERASWGWLLLAGVVGGGPTFLGTLVGTIFHSDLVFVAFLALAAGAILYVVGELFSAGRRLSWEITLWGVFVGFIIGLGTELVLVAAKA